MSDELLPCPFCGGKPHWPEPEVNMDFAGCTECQACAPSVRVWNNRADATALQTLTDKVEALEAALRNPPRHRFWGAGEPDCPREIKAGNGELHTLRCKVCGEDSPRDDICRAALTKEGKSA